MSITELLEAHELVITGDSDAGPENWGAQCRCGEIDDDYDDATAELHMRHVAELMEQHMQEREAQAWQKGVDTALNHAILNPDGITLRLEHLDGRPWANPYRKASSDGR